MLDVYQIYLLKRIANLNVMCMCTYFTKVPTLLHNHAFYYWSIIVLLTVPQINKSIFLSCILISDLINDSGLKNSVTFSDMILDINIGTNHVVDSISYA